MPFTIQVEPVELDRDFSIHQLTLHHGECGGGLISGDAIEKNAGLWHIQCSRCGVMNAIHVSASGTSAVAKTAVDGEQRTVDHWKEYDSVVAVRYQKIK
jgi:hypothetical protein